jgi:hypothetical protein
MDSPASFKEAAKVGKWFAKKKSFRREGFNQVSNVDYCRCLIMVNSLLFIAGSSCINCP